VSRIIDHLRPAISMSTVDTLQHVLTQLEGVQLELPHFAEAVTEHRTAAGTGLIVEASAASARTHIFVSYSHKDAAWRDRVRVHLKPLVRTGQIDLWDDTRLKPGSNWLREIEQAIDSARAAVLLVSPDFLASDFIHTKEVPPLLEKAAAGGAIVLSVIVNPCLFKRTALARYQAVNDPSRALNGLSPADAEAVLVKLAETIADAMPVGGG
jgi:hypothetical protein